MLGHRTGQFRRWIGRRFGGDLALGDRVWRRCLHLLGAFVLVYYLVPPGFFVLLPNEVVLLIALSVVLLLELCRHLGIVELPTIRPFEARRVASFAYFAVALVAAVLLFPRPIAVAVVLGTALVDPLIGELRLSARWARAYPSVPVAAYAAVAAAAFLVVGGYAVLSAVALAVGASVLAVGVERVRSRHLDDDLTMTLVPGIALTILLIAGPSLAALGR